MPDAIRYTFEYRESRYTKGVWADIGRLKEQGFELHKLMEYLVRKISIKASTANGSIRIPASGSKYNSTPASASRRSSSRMLPTNGSGSRQPDKFEQLVLEAFEKKVSAEVPSPARRCRYSRLSIEERDARQVTYYAVVDDLSSRGGQPECSGVPTPRWRPPRRSIHPESDLGVQRQS